MENEEQPAAELSKEERIEAHFSTDSEHDNKFMFNVYTRTVESGLFDDIEVPLDAFKYAENIFWQSKNSPLSGVKFVMNLFDKQDDPPFTDERKQFLLDQLIEYYSITYYTDANGQRYQLDRIRTLLRQERDKLTKSDEVEPEKYDWKATKQHISTLPDTHTKIAYLLERKAEYEQIFDGWKLNLGQDYGEKCQTEIKKLKDLAELEQQGKNPKSPFKMLGKPGNKTNLIRLLNALYELKMIDLESGQHLTKDQFMNQIGSFIGVDMNRYEQTLSKALEQPLEANLAIFEELKQVIQAQVLARLEKGRK